MNDNILQDFSYFINPTKISQSPYNLNKQTLYDFKKERTNAIWNKTKDIIVQYLKDILADQDLKARFEYIIIQKFCTEYGADYQNIQHYKKGRLKSLSEKNILIVNDFFNNIQEYLDEQELLKDMPAFREKDKVRFKYQCSDYNHNGFLGAGPILNHKKEWVAPVFIYGIGSVYIQCNDMKLIRKLSSK